MFELLIFLSVGCGVISALLLLMTLRKSITKLPENWKKSSPLNNFRLGVSFLTIFLILVILSESFSLYLRKHGIYNSFVFSIYFTLSTPFLFGFLFINTQTSWKRYAYFILYTVLIGHLIYGGYYHPRCILPSSSSLLLFSIYFIAFLIQLTDLLVSPKADHFRFQLKINLSFLIYSLIASIVTSYNWQETISDPIIYELIYNIHIFNILLLYSVLTFIFITENLKLTTIAKSKK